MPTNIENIIFLLHICIPAVTATEISSGIPYGNTRRLTYLKHSCCFGSFVFPCHYLSLPCFIGSFSTAAVIISHAKAGSKGFFIRQERSCSCLCIVKVNILFIYLTWNKADGGIYYIKWQIMINYRSDIDMKCPNCGHELEPGSGFCENCGMITSLENEEAPASS